MPINGANSGRFFAGGARSCEQGETDVAKEVTAASTRVIADVACKRGGW